MKIVQLLAFAMFAGAITAALERRKVDQQEGNELEDVDVGDDRDKRHSVGAVGHLHASRLSSNRSVKKLGVRHMTHNAVQKRYGTLRRRPPLFGLGSGLSRTRNRRVFGAGIRGPLGESAIYGDGYDRDLRLTRGK